MSDYPLTDKVIEGLTRDELDRAIQNLETRGFVHNSALSHDGRC